MGDVKGVWNERFEFEKMMVLLLLLLSVVGTENRNGNWNGEVFDQFV